jgi:hypothetical protein
MVDHFPQYLMHLILIRHPMQFYSENFVRRCFSSVLLQ